MFFFDGHIHLTDTDLMGKVGIFPCDNGTMSRLPKVFQNVRCDNNDRTAPMSAYKKDQYSFFVSMIEARYKKRPTTETPPFPGDTIQKFVKALRCDESLQRELLNFLSNPALHALSQPMINYLVAPTTSL